MPRSTESRCWRPTCSKDPRYIEANPETRSELAIPLIYKDKVIGVLDIEHTRRNYFNEDHVRIMTTMAAQVAIAIENATLYERIARQEKRLEQDLALARELQFRLLPQKLPVFKNAEVASRFAPARQIGGDLYDFLKYSGAGRDRDCGGRRQRQGRAGGDLRGAGERHRALARHGRAERGRHAGGHQPVAVGAAHRRAIRLDDLRHLGRQAAARCSSPTPACRGRFIAATARSRRFRRQACRSGCSLTRRMKS